MDQNPDQTGGGASPYASTSNPHRGNGGAVVNKKPMNPLSLILILSGAFFVFFMIAAVVLFNMTAGSFAPESNSGGFLGGSQKDSIGVVEVKGVIMNSKKVLKQLEEFEDRKSVKAVVLRVESPGGAVAPSQEIYDAVREFKKPLFVSMGTVAASGGYYIAMGAKKGRVFANPGTITGSIGVIMEFANLKDLYKWAKIDRYSITSGKNKDIGAEYKDMSPEQKKLLQDMVEDVWIQFVAAVAAGREMKAEEVKPLADGRIYSGAQAAKLNLVDGTKPIQDVIVEAAAAVSIDKDKINVVYPSKQRKRFFEMLMEAGDEEDEEVSFGRSALSLFRQLLSQDRVASPLVLDPGLYLLWDGARI